MPHEVWDMASFSTEIDLHIECLVDDPSAYPTNKILALQLRHFEDYMDRAIRLGVDRVFIIHGLGEGKLRQAIHNRLREMEAVKSFENAYHPLYGHGATEVLF
ncbi:MAG: Smr/MutS family protein [Saprospiraceae bacterium]